MGDNEEKKTDVVVVNTMSPAIVNSDSLIKSAIDKGASIDMLERLLDLQERVKKEEAEKAFRQAMADFQSKCPVIIKSSGVDYISKKGAHVKYEYASLDAIIIKVREHLAVNGLSYTFTTEQNENSVTAICHANHILGHTESTSFTIPIDPEAYMNAAQKVASALTYAKRYAFCNAFGILTGEADDDGHGGRANKTQSKAQARPQQKPAGQAKPNVGLMKLKTKNLSESAQAYFRSLKWSLPEVFAFCKKHNFNNVKIDAEIKAKTEKTPEPARKEGEPSEEEMRKTVLSVLSKIQEAYLKSLKWSVKQVYSFCADCNFNKSKITAEIEKLKKQKKAS